MTIDQVTTHEEAMTNPEEVAKPQPQPQPRRRGFAAMDRDRVKEIASKGGRAAHAAGTAHEFTHDEATSAGRKGGIAPHVRRGAARSRSAPANEPSTIETLGAPSER